jgi:histidine triad (HIT) family protein
MVDDCLFCKIVSGDIPSAKVYEDEGCYAFRDTNPQAPFHALVVPRGHFTDLADLGRDPEAAGAFVAGIRALTEQEGILSFRTVFNTGADAQQTVFHVHAHVLAGRPFSWPPG